MVNSQGLPAPGPCSHSGPRGWKPLAIFPCPLWGREQTAQHQNPPARSNPRGPPLQARPQAVPPLRRDRWDGVLRIMRPRTSEIPPVLSRNRSLAQTRHPTLPHKGGRGITAPPARTAQQKLTSFRVRSGAAPPDFSTGQGRRSRRLQSPLPHARCEPDEAPPTTASLPTSPPPLIKGGQGRSRPSVFSSRREPPARQYATNRNRD